MSKLTLVFMQKNEIKKREQQKIKAGMEDACSCLCAPNTTNNKDAVRKLNTGE